MAPAPVTQAGQAFGTAPPRSAAGRARESAPRSAPPERRPRHQWPGPEAPKLGVALVVFSVAARRRPVPWTGTVRALAW